MKAKTLQDLEIWQLSKTFACAISAILDRPTFKRDRRLWEQLGDSSSSVLSNVSEGYGQRSDKMFLKYLAIARGSNNEAHGQVGVAFARRHISKSECDELERLSDTIGKKITTLMKYLESGRGPTQGGSQN